MGGLKSVVIAIAAAAACAHIAAAAAACVNRFNRRSIGIVTQPVGAAF